MRRLNYYRIFLIALAATTITILVKYLLHSYGLEPIEQTSLHNSMVSAGIFVMGFVLSATIVDYKESERIPADFASTIESMYDDAKEIHREYPKFDLELFRKNLVDVLATFREGTRVNRKGARREISELNRTFGDMERAGVPPNFIVKLKQQQAQLMRSLFRVNYIQKIKFIPSAFFLVRSIVVIVIGALLLTNIDPFYGGLVLTGTIAFILVYMLVLIQVISVPFHAAGKTRDDVSLFLLKEARAYLQSEKK